MGVNDLYAAESRQAIDNSYDGGGMQFLYFADSTYGSNSSNRYSYSLEMDYGNPLGPNGGLWRAELNGSGMTNLPTSSMSNIEFHTEGGGVKDYVLQFMSSGLSGQDMLDADWDWYAANIWSTNNKITGSDFADNLSGYAGDDTIYGHDPNDDEFDMPAAADLGDTINGDEGNDSLYGGLGGDTMFGGDDNDLVYGGDGGDKLYGDGQKDLMYGDGGKDKMYGGLGTDKMYGGDGNDGLWGNESRDKLWGDKGNDKVYGGNGNDGLWGNEARDKLWGGKGNDKLYGGDGKDFLYGGKGDDVLVGGTGNDVFVFAKGHGSNRIKDFEDGFDKIKITQGANDFGDLTISNNGGDAKISFKNVEIVLLEVDAGDLSASDFIF